MANTAYLVTIQQSLASGAVVVTAPMPESFSMDTAASYETALPQSFTNNNAINLVGSVFGTRMAVQALTAQLWKGNSETDLNLMLEFQTEVDPVADVRNPIVNLLKMTMPSTSSSTGLLTSPGPQLDLNQLGGIAVDFLKTSGNSALTVASAAGNKLLSAFGAPNVQVGQLNNTSTSSNDGANSTIPATNQKNPSLGTAAYWKSRVKNPISITLGNHMRFDSVVITHVNQTYASDFDSLTNLPHHCVVQISFRPLFMLTQQDLDDIFINPSGGSTPLSNVIGAGTSQFNKAFGGSNQYGFSA